MESDQTLAPTAEHDEPGRKPVVNQVERRREAEKARELWDASLSGNARPVADGVKCVPKS